MASITRRENKSGIAYKIQVKVKDKGSGKDIVRSTTWQVPAGMSAKQAERAVIVEAEKYEEQMKKILSSSADIQGDEKITFAKFAEIWLEKCKQENSEIYYVNSVKCINTANQYIGGYKLTELNPRIIQNFYGKIDKLKMTTYKVTPYVDKIREAMSANKMRFTDMKKGSNNFTATTVLNGKPVKLQTAERVSEILGRKVEELFEVEKTEKPYAHETIHKVKRTVRAILALAKKQRLVDDNYATADYITFPKKPKVEIDHLDDVGAKKLYQALEECDNPQKKIAILIPLLTGMRKGELCGLEWGDIDFEKSTISIQRSRISVNTVGVIDKSTKTASSERTLTMPNRLKEELLIYKAWQEARIETFGDKWENSGRILTSEFGGKIHPSVPNGWLNDIVKKAGLPHVTLHSLRHTNITLQIMAGVPLVTVSGRAGHARTSTTTDIYSHFLKSSDKEAADKLDSIFG